MFLPLCVISVKLKAHSSKQIPFFILDNTNTTCEAVGGIEYSLETEQTYTHTT